MCYFGCPKTGIFFNFFYVDVKVLPICSIVELLSFKGVIQLAYLACKNGTQQ